RVQSKRFYADGDARSFELFNLSTTHTFRPFRGFECDWGLGVENLLDFVDNRPFGVNYATLSPGRMFYTSLSIRFGK
ncbi:MAG: TonB-dependent receptor, partial [Rikenellaceae bacterium]|nr:TonB-dependent receptor [Rikenellaceae bacterium]